METYVFGEDYLKIKHPYLRTIISSSGFVPKTSRLTQVGHQKEFGLVGNYISSSSIGDNNYEGTYYVHSDHIGSAAWITNQNGTAVQHLQYMAWGELFADQRSTDYSTRYTFSGKERDAETGYSYFGFRYYLVDP
ncbi:MAG: hypothetical protein R3Y59_10395 [bacterium]